MSENEIVSTGMVSALLILFYQLGSLIVIWISNISLSHSWWSLCYCSCPMTMIELAWGFGVKGKSPLRQFFWAELPFFPDISHSPGKSRLRMFYIIQVLLVVPVSSSTG